jgi:hypothetical protein
MTTPTAGAMAALTVLVHVARYQIYPRAVAQGRFAGRWFGPRACNTAMQQQQQQRHSSTTANTAGAAAGASATTNELVYLSIPRRLLRFIRCSSWCCKSK